MDIFIVYCLSLINDNADEMMVFYKNICSFEYYFIVFDVLNVHDSLRK